MKWKKPLTHSLDILAALSVGLIAIALSFTDNISFLRIFFGFFFIFFAAGYPVSIIFFPQKKILSKERFITTTLMSLLMLYPAGVLTTIFEGQSTADIFQRHITHSLLSLFILQLAVSLYAFKVKHKSTIKKSQLTILKNNKILFASITIFLILTTWNLNRADVRGDEYDLGYQAYNLVDGILAKRRAFTISFNTHPPLMLHVKHFTMQILNPKGLDFLEDWQFRVTEAVLGLLSIFYAYFLSKKYFSKTAAQITALLLSVNNYMIFMGRFFERSVYLMPFAIASIYWFLNYLDKKKNKFIFLSGLSLGGAFLVKASALSTMLAFILFVLANRKKNFIKPLLKLFSLVLMIYSPVILYNILSYMLVGMVDSNFSRLLGIYHPFATQLTNNNITLNLLTIVSLLIDQYSVIVFLLFTISLYWTLVKRKKTQTEILLLSWVISILIFFSLTTVRAYYMVFITIPLAILSASMIGSLKGKYFHVRLLIITISLLISVTYSFNTNIDSSYVISREHQDSGRSGEALLIPSINKHYSISARSWTENWGWKNLVIFLDKKIKKEDCLIVDEELDNLAVRKYLWTNDLVKEHFFGQSYTTRYNRCLKDDQGTVRTIYFLSDEVHEAGNLVEVISDSLGNPRFYLFTLPKGNFT